MLEERKEQTAQKAKDLGLGGNCCGDWWQREFPNGQTAIGAQRSHGKHVGAEGIELQA